MREPVLVYRPGNPLSRLRALWVLAATCLPVLCGAAPLVLDWGDYQDTFVRDQSLSPGADTYVPASGVLTNPYTGLSGSTGGVGTDEFRSQVLSNVAGSGVNITVHYSRNNHDGTGSDDLEGPDFYDPALAPDKDNPDARVLGDYALRTNRDVTSPQTPTTIVLSFSEPVFINEFIVGSLSEVGSSHENALIRAFATADATGTQVKATYFENISDLTDGSSLLHGVYNPGADPTSNSLANVDVDPDLSLDAGGVATNVGSTADDGIYHVIGVNNQSGSPGAYGRVKLAWEDPAMPVQSLVISQWASSSINFASYNTTTQWISAIVAPVTFERVPEPSSLVLSIGFVALFVRHRRRRSRGSACGS